MQMVRPRSRWLTALSAILTVVLCLGVSPFAMLPAYGATAAKGEAATLNASQAPDPDTTDINTLNAQAMEALTSSGLKVTKAFFGFSTSGAITDDGRLWTWGDNSTGKVGIGDVNGRHPLSQSMPVAVLDNVIDAAFGMYHVAAIKSDHSLWTWGDAYYGAIGNGGTGDSVAHAEYSPVYVTDNVKTVNVSQGNTAVIKNDNSFWIWGSNTDGQIGDGTQTPRVLTPKQMMTDVVDVAMADYRTLVVKKDGSVWAWGNNRFGEIAGQEDDDYILSPMKLADGAVDVEVNVDANYVRKADGTLWAWGYNGYGEVGLSNSTIVDHPTQILDNVKKVSGDGYTFSGALKNDGTLWTWGYDPSTNGTMYYHSTPEQLTDSVGDFALGRYTVTLLKNDGTVWQIGRIYDNSDDGKFAYPSLTQVFSSATAILSGDYHFGAIKNDGTLWAWGDNFRSRLGDGTETSTNTPVKILGDNVYVPQPSLSLDKDSISFRGTSNGSFTPESQVVSVRFRDCVLNDPPTNEYVDVVYDGNASSLGNAAYRVTPKNPVTQIVMTTLEFSAASEDESLTAPKPVTVTVTLTPAAIGTHVGVNYGTDTYNFYNGKSYFTSDYMLTGEYKDFFLDGFSDSAQRSLTDRMASEWGGSCFGMSVVLTLLKYGALDPDFFQANAKCAHDFEYPVNNANVRNLINFYQLCQFIGPIGAAAYDESIYESVNSQNLINALNKSEYPVVFCINLYIIGFPFPVAGHALLAYDYTQTDRGYEVKVWDPNDMYKPLTYLISYDFQTSEFIGTNDYDNSEWMSELTSSIPVDKELSALSTYKNLEEGLKAMGYTSGYSLAAESNRATLQVNYPSFTIKSSTGASAVVENAKKVSGSIDISDGSPQNEKDTDLRLAFDLPRLGIGETYTVTPTGQAPTSRAYETSLLDDTSSNGFYSAIEADANGTFTIGAGGSVTSDLVSGASQKVTVTTNNASTSWPTISAEGSADTLQVTPASDAHHAITTNASTMLSVTASNLYNDATLTATGSTFTVSEPEVGKVQLASENETTAKTLGHSAVFYTGGGTAIETQSNIQPGDTVKKPTDPTREGYTFVGWYTLPDYKTAYDFNMPVGGDIKLYAKWTEGEGETITIYRLYNKWSGEHLFTKNYQEYMDRGAGGWEQEGIAWYSAGEDGMPVYRLYNPYVTIGTHHYTTDKSEYDRLGTMGMQQESIGWYGLK